MLLFKIRLGKIFDLYPRTDDNIIEKLLQLTIK